MRVRVANIPHGLPGTLETLRAIFRAIKRGQLNPQVVAFTRAAVGDLEFQEERKIIDNIVDAWTSHVKIIEDPIAADWLQDAEITLQQGRGDCDDLVIAVGASLESVGFRVELIVGSFVPDGVDKFSHVWMRAWMPVARQWLSIDPRGIIDKQIGFRIGQEVRRDSLTAIGSYGYDADRGQLIDGVSVASQVEPRRRNFILSRVRGTERERSGMVGVAGCIDMPPAGLGNPNAPVETFITTGAASAQGQTVQPLVNITSPTAIQERIVLLQAQASELEQQRDAAVVGPEAAGKAARSQNIQKRLSPWLAAFGIGAAATAIVQNLRS